MAERARSQRVAAEDPRSVAVAGLYGAGGAFVGGAAVLADDLAVTTYDVIAAAREFDAEFDKTGAASEARLFLAFSAFSDPPSFYQIPARVEVVDPDFGFALLRLAAELPRPLSIDLLRNGAEPVDGDQCDILYYQQNGVFAIPSQVGSPVGPRFSLAVNGEIRPRLSGSPVFSGRQLVGIVSPVRKSSPFQSHGFSAGLQAAPQIEALSIAYMSRSRVTSIVRSLLLPVLLPSDLVGPTPSRVQVSQVGQGASSGSAASEGSALRPRAASSVDPVGPSDEELWARLTPSSRSALEKAAGMGQFLDHDSIHMEYLIAALFDKPAGPTQQVLGAAKVDRQRLAQIIRETVGTVIPENYRAPELARLPRLSKHVREALIAAAREVGGAAPIRTRHLLGGVLSVEDCRVVRALVDVGVKKENIALLPSRNEDLGLYDPLSEVDAETATPQPSLTSPAANPTPKVASDLWCREDRLGYEAYARTIAELITHEETVAPLTIGIKAPWGAGKTSLMKRVQEFLDGYASLTEGSRTGILQDLQPQLTLKEMLAQLKDAAKPMGLELKPGKAYKFPPRITVWFNAWKYQTSEQVWAGMAHCIISQVTARMKVRDRELFWLRLHARRVNVEEVRRKVHESIVRQLIPMAAGMLLVCLAAIWIALAIPILPLRYVAQGVSALAWFFWVRREWVGKLGETAAGTVRNLIREPDYEGKMGYLHLVETDMREVLDLVTAAQIAPEETPVPTKKAGKGAATGAKAQDHSGTDAALKRRSSTKAPLVVFVDDLDRCAPNKVADVVEAINLFLCGDYPNCIFVLGMEPGMVAAALEVANKDVIQKAEEMGLTDQSVPVGWRFMEKIIQLPIMIPPPTPSGRESYVESLTGAHEFNAHMGGMMESMLLTEVQGPSGMLASSGTLPNAIVDREKAHAAAQEPLKEEDIEKYMSELTGRSLSEVEEKSKKVLADAAPEKRRAAAEASKRAYAQAFVERDPLMAKFVKEVAQLVDGNPRQIKRYVNVFRFYSTLRHSLQVDGVAAQGELPSDEMMAKFVALSVHWPHAMDCLRKKDAKASEANGRKVTLLELLELESRKTPTEVAAVDAAWEKFVGKEGVGLGAWAVRPAFREFLARGESLFQNEGHGLW